MILKVVKEFTNGYVEEHSVEVDTYYVKEDDHGKRIYFNERWNPNEVAIGRFPSYISKVFVMNDHGKTVDTIK